MAEYGLLPDGFHIPVTAEIREEIEQDLRDKFGKSFPLGDYTFAGHMSGIVSERIAICWEGLEVVNSSQDPDKAVADGLKVLCVLTGTYAAGATYTVALATLTGDDAASIPSGSRASASSTGKQFEIQNVVALVALDEWTPSMSYAFGDRVTNASRCYQCVTAGVSASSGGPSTTDADIPDGAVHWVYLGDGTAAKDAYAVSVDPGPIECTSGDLTSIDTPSAGWLSLTNLADADVGSYDETDEELRVRRESELHQAGTGPYEAVRAALLNVSGVRSVSILFNVSDAVDDRGVPPHSFEALVRGGDDADIARVLWLNGPLGIRTFGSTSVDVVDSEGRVQPMAFSRPFEKLIHVRVSVQKIAASYAGDDAVVDSVASWGNSLGLDYDVFSSAASAHAFVGGVVNVTECLISIDPTDPPVSSASLIMGPRDLPVFDSSRVVVVSSNVTP